MVAKRKNRLIHLSLFFAWVDILALFAWGSYWSREESETRVKSLFEVIPFLLIGFLVLFSLLYIKRYLLRSNEKSLLLYLVFLLGLLPLSFLLLLQERGTLPEIRYLIYLSKFYYTQFIFLKGLLLFITLLPFLFRSVGLRGILISFGLLYIFLFRTMIVSDASSLPYGSQFPFYPTVVLFSYQLLDLILFLLTVICTLLSSYLRRVKRKIREWAFLPLVLGFYWFMASLFTPLNYVALALFALGNAFFLYSFLYGET